MSRFALRHMATVCGCVFASVLMVAPMEAAVVFGTGTLGGTVDNVHFDTSQTGLTVIGTVGPANHDVLFSQPVSPEIFRAHSGGQAFIEPSVGDTGFTSLRTQLVNGDLFSRFEIASTYVTNVTFRVWTDDGLFFDYLGSANGQTRINVVGTEGTAFRYIDLIAPANTLASVRQVRIGGITPAEVPEPSTWVMLTMGLAIVFGISRRKRASQQLAVDGVV